MLSSKCYPCRRFHKIRLTCTDCHGTSGNTHEANFQTPLCLLSPECRSLCICPTRCRSTPLPSSASLSDLPRLGTSPPATAPTTAPTHLQLPGLPRQHQRQRPVPAVPPLPPQPVQGAKEGHVNRVQVCKKFKDTPRASQNNDNDDDRIR